MAPACDLPYDGDGVCMVCKAMPTEVEEYPDCSPSAATLIPTPIATLSGASGNLIFSIWAIEVDTLLIEEKKARRRQALDIEFTVQKNRLWMMQCRTGKCTGKGAVKIAVDIVKEGLVHTRSAIKMVEPGHLDQLLHPQVDFQGKNNCIFIHVRRMLVEAFGASSMATLNQTRQYDPLAQEMHQLKNDMQKMNNSLEMIQQIFQAMTTPHPSLVPSSSTFDILDFHKGILLQFLFRFLSLHYGFGQVLGLLLLVGYACQ
ncbi:hypothetical protein COCNU_scaffold007163G000010 [Cocos nucifera]|nr:hypothetical protein [Cocos nucifera]